MSFSIFESILQTFVLSVVIILYPMAANPNFHDGDFVLSAAPGFYDEPFYLSVSIPSMPDAAIYWTIDGTIPGGADRFVQRNNHIIQVSGLIPANGKIAVNDRSGYWQYSILTAHSEQWSRTTPAEDAEILQGTAFRFKGFIDGQAVTTAITATYIIASNAAERFSNMPVIAVTAPYEDFLYIYYHADAREPVTRRRVFNYEYFELSDNEYTRIFNMPGSSSLGGNSTRSNAQRTINVHLARGQLDGFIEHPIFPGLYELYRFRLWNGGNNFREDFFRDTFAQTSSVGLNVQGSDNQLAIKFINGEFWGFTSIREHTSNRHFINTRFGIDIDNVAIIDRSHIRVFARDSIDSVVEGDEAVVLALYDEFARFLRRNDMASDYARERLFNEFLCKYNFMDYIIANTFFYNRDWPQNNVRFFRAITPDANSPNPYNDGRWRFILHDMDLAPRTGEPQYTYSRFSYVYRPRRRANDQNLWLNYAFRVFDNPSFAEQFRERALYVLENHFTQDQLLTLHDEFIMQYNPLLLEMYNRFPVRGSVDESIDNFNTQSLQLRTFLINREYYYRKQLDALVERAR